MGIDETVHLNTIVERTAEYEEVDDYFTQQRNDLILGLSIVSLLSIILPLLLSSFGQRYFARQYVVWAVEELYRAAEDTARGAFEGEVEVDEKSAYAALQGLLRSGQKVLRRMDEHLNR